jgi:hypothetical protein
MRTLQLTLAAAALLALAGPTNAAALTDSLKDGTVELKSAGPLAFGPDGVLFIGDAIGGAVYAVATNDTKAGTGDVQVPKIDEKIAGKLGTAAKELRIADMAVNPASGNVYLSVARGKGPEAPAVIIRVSRDGTKVDEFALTNVKCAKAALQSPNEKQRAQSITGMKFLADKGTGIQVGNGRLIVAGLANEEFASTLRVIPFPFAEGQKPTGVEIFHTSHNKTETGSPIRTFTPFESKGETYILAAYTCTPLVRIPVADLKPGSKIRGTTIAELGNRNVPLDMVPYQKDGKDYLLIANSARGVMKVDASGATKAEGLTARVADKAGIPYETIETLKGVEHLDQLDKEKAVILVKAADGYNLQTINLP